MQRSEDALLFPLKSALLSTSIKSACIALVAALALFAAPMRAANNPCTTNAVTVITDPSNDQNGSQAGLNQQTDIQSISLAEDYTTVGQQRLVAIMKVASLTSIPANTSWHVSWFFGGTNYYVGMNSDQSSNVTYEYGTIANSLLTPSGGADAGSYTSAGVITIAVGLSKIGAPATGSQLTQLSGDVQTLVGAAGTGLLLGQDDTSNGTSPANFTYTLAGQPLGCTPAPQPTAATPNYVKGGINFSPNFTVRAPYIGQDVEPSIAGDFLGNVYVSAIRGVPAGSDLWYFDLRPTVPDAFGNPQPNPMYDPWMRNPQYRGQPDGIQGGQEITFGGDGGGDSAIAVGTASPGNGAPPYVAYASLVAGNISTQRSTDMGQSFLVNPLGNLTGGPGGDDRQWLAFYGPSTVYLIYRTLDPAVLQVQQSVDGGLTYGPTTVGGTIGQVGGVAVDQNDGTVYVAGSTGSVAVGIPPAPGLAPLSYTVVPVASGSVAHIFFTIKVGPDGTVYVCYSDEANVYIQYSKNHGSTWSGPIRVSNGPETSTSVLPWMEVGPVPGMIGVVWYGTSAPQNSDSADWKVFYALGTNVTSSTPTFQQAVASDHIIHAANISENGLVVGGVSPNRNLADFFQVTFDPLGAAVIAFCDDHNDFAGHSYVTRQISGPAVNGGTVPAPVEGSSVPAPNPNGAIQVRDERDDVRTGGNAEAGGLVVLHTDDPVDIVGAQYWTGTASDGSMQIVAQMTVSNLAVVPPEAFWRMNFAANVPNTGIAPSGDWDFGASDRGDQFYVKAVTDSTGAQSFVYGTAVRNFSGGIVYTDQGTADAGAINSVTNTVQVRLSVNKLNALLAANNRPQICGGSTIAGLRAQAAIITPDGSNFHLDSARGGTELLLNRPPIAALTATPVVGASPDQVTFDGSASSDPDPCDRAAQYTFNFGDGSAPVMTSSPTVSHTYTHYGAYTATLTVADNSGTPSPNTASATITVHAPPSAALTATPASAPAPANVTLSGAGSSDADPNDTIVSYSFNFGDGSPVVTQSTASVSHTYARGTYTAALTVTDKYGDVSSPASVVITAANNPPVASNDSFTVVWNLATTLNPLANDTDKDGDALTITGVSKPSHGAAVTNGSTVTYTPAKNYVGTDSFTYTISDGHGGTATATVLITVVKK